MSFMILFAPVAIFNCLFLFPTNDFQPRVLVEALFRAFAADLTRRVDIDVFLSTYAVIDSLGFVDTNKVNAQLLLMQKRCLFKIYELADPELSTAAGVLERRRVEDILRVAYGDKLRPHLNEVQKQLDNIFHPTHSSEITLKVSTAAPHQTKQTKHSSKHHNNV